MFKKTIFKNIFVISLCSLALGACSSGAENIAENNVKTDALVKTVTTVAKDIPINLHSFGTIAPSQTVSITARSGGQLLKSYVTNGQYVEAGTLLFEIDKEPYVTALKASRAKAEGSKAQLNKSTGDTKRANKLASDGFVSQSEVEDASTGEAALRAALKADEAAIQKAELDLSYCDIVAPISGRIGSVKVDVGNYIAPAQTQLVSLEQIQPAKLTFSVPEVYLSRIREEFEKGKLDVKVVTQSGDEATGKLNFIGNIDVSTGTVSLEAEFPNENLVLWGGQFVQVVLTLEVMQNAVSVPARAINYGPDGTFVFVIDENLIAHYRLVTVTAEENGEGVISEGLKAGDMVVLEGHVRVVDGGKVRLAADEMPDATSAQTTSDNA